MQTLWIGVDWGTSNLRVFAVDRQSAVVAERQSGKGMATLQPEQFESALLELIDPWLANTDVTSVFVCGMAGARQGWREAAYRTIPCTPVCSDDMTVIPTSDKRINVRVLPGLCQQNPSDVMRGEETQLAGLLKIKPAFHGSVCLPGTHCKWVSIEDNQVTSFKTFMTGELFSLLCQQSVLKHSVNTSDWDDAAFLAAASTAINAPADVLPDLFTIRASSLLHDSDSATSRSRLSGMLVGQELGMTKHYWQHQEVVIIGDPQVTSLYRRILSTLETTVDTLDASEATVAGLALVANGALT